MDPRVLTIQLPASKSHANRALICAAFSDTPVQLIGYSPSSDTEAMITALRACGVEIAMHGEQDTEGKNSLIVTGGIERLHVPRHGLTARDAGTTMRFLITFLGAIVARAGGEACITGSPRMQERPVRDLLEALASLNIQGESLHGNGCPPIKILARGSTTAVGGETHLRGNASSQYMSSILLSAPYFSEDTEVLIDGELTSKPYVDMSIAVMNEFGVSVRHDVYERFFIPAKQRYHRAEPYTIEPDASGASYFIAGAALTGASVFFPGLRRPSVQGDARFVEIVSLMQTDAVIRDTAEGMYFEGGTTLHGIDIDLNAMPDMAQTLAFLAVFASGETVIRNVWNLRIKETDRLRALSAELKKFGVEAKESKDCFSIIGNPSLTRSCAAIQTYNDHRMAMSAAVAKLRLPDIIIENPSCVRKSFPLFWDEWGKMG